MNVTVGLINIMFESLCHSVTLHKKDTRLDQRLYRL